MEPSPLPLTSLEILERKTSTSSRITYGGGMAAIAVPLFA